MRPYGYYDTGVQHAHVAEITQRLRSEALPLELRGPRDTALRSCCHHGSVCLFASSERMGPDRWAHFFPLPKSARARHRGTRCRHLNGGGAREAHGPADRRRGGWPLGVVQEAAQGAQDRRTTSDHCQPNPSQAKRKRGGGARPEAPRKPDSLSSLPAHPPRAAHTACDAAAARVPPPRGVVVGRYRQGLNGAMNDPDPSRQVAEHEGLTDEQVAELRREWGENALPEKGKSKLVLLLTLPRAPTLRPRTDPTHTFPLPTDY